MVRRMVGIVMVLALAGGAPACSRGGGRPTPVREALGDLLPLQTSPDRRIVDTAGRDVLLRGANVNSLGEYWQGVPALAPTVRVTDADWASMAAHGFSVVRLLVSWSRIEPERGVIDRRYLDRVDEHVRAADEHGIYTVIDMH